MSFYPEFSPQGYDLNNIEEIIRQIEYVIIQSNGNCFTCVSYDNERHFRLYLKDNISLSSSAIRFLSDWASYSFKYILDGYEGCLKTSRIILEINMELYRYFQNMIAKNTIYLDLYSFYFEQGIPKNEGS